jgi:hypothetical protein
VSGKTDLLKFLNGDTGEPIDVPYGRNINE